MISERLAAQVELHPERTAIVFGERRISFQSLWNDSTALSRGLQELGVGNGSAVAVLSENTPEFVIIYLALARLGAVAVPLNVAFKPAEIASSVAASGAALLLASPQLLAAASAASTRAVSPPRLVPISDGEGLCYGSLLRQGQAAAAQASVLKQGGPFICLFSSGSSGRPKRLLRTQVNYLAEVDGFRGAIGLNAADRTLCAIPLYHSYAIGNCLLPSLLTGGRLVLPTALDAGLTSEQLVHHRMSQLLELIASESVTIFPNVPFVFRALLDHDQASASALEPLRYCFSSGNFLPRDIQDEFRQRFGKLIRPIYGCSEAGTVSVNVAEGEKFQPDSVGVPLAGYQIRIVQADGSPAPAGVTGEIVISGPGLTAGYPDLPELTSEVLRDGWFRTGDLGRLDEDQALTVTGRVKLLIDTGGRKVDPFEVEDVLCAHPGVREAVVLGVPTAKGNEIVKAVVVSADGLSIEAVQAFCKERLADYKVPRIIQVVEQIPKSPTGKILRKEFIRPGDAVPELRELLLDIVRRGLERIEACPNASTPFAELGIDSATIVELNLLIAEHFPGVSKTLFFEHSNFGEIVAHLQGQYPAAFAALRDELRRPPRADGAPRLHAAAAARGAAERVEAEPATPAESTAGPLAPAKLEPSAVAGAAAALEDEIAIVGMAGLFPDADNLEELWANLVAGHDAIREIPGERWAVDEYFDARRGTSGKTYGRWGGFIRDVDAFDPLFFSIAPRDAALMDPQERLFLQTAYHALEDAGHTRATLSAETVGVYVGVMYGEYQLWAARDPSRGVPSSLYASIANRLSYFAGFRGPSMAVDTMCSSSLTALFLACENLQRGHASMAVVGGVNLSLHPAKYLQTAHGNFLSSDGRCRSFGEGGDGYVPGEGVVALVLKPLRRALADGDRIRAVIAATAVNHGGASNGFTVPAPRAQAQVIGAALRRAGIKPAEIGYVEAHGTGTQLGDPIELSGLGMAMESLGGRSERCPLGSIKSNIGHLEAAAGLAGVAKVVLQFQHETLVPSLHSQRLNSNFDFSSSPFAVQRELGKWPWEPGRARIACVSSFGAGGSNAHAVLREPPARERASAALVPVVLISAKDEESLRALVDRWLAWLETSDAPLAAIAAASQLGREALEQRLAVVCRDAKELLAALRGWRAGGGSPAQLFAGRINGSNARWSGASGRAFVDFLVQQRDFANLAECWVQGADVSWRAFYGPQRPELAALPAYPFAKQRYWLPGARRESAAVAGVSSEASAAASESVVRLFEPCWEPALPAPAAAAGNVRLVCLVPSAHFGEALARAARAVPCIEAVSYLIPSASAPLEAWPAVTGGAVATTAQSVLQSTGAPLAIIDVVDGERASAAALARPLVEAHLLRSMLAAAGVRVSSWTFVSTAENAAGAALAGLAPALSRGIAVRALRVAGGNLAGAESAILAAALAGSEERERRISSAGTEALAMRALGAPESAAARLREGSVYLITGGLGELGAWVAEVLLAKAPVQLCLVGRSPLDPARREKLERLRRGAGRVEYHALDLADEVALAQLLSRVRSTQGAIRGVFHCAGVPDVDSAGIPSLESSSRTLRPKVQGTLALDAATRGDELDFFVMFASVSAWLGDFGQGVYAVGNRFQVEFAQERKRAVERGERRGHTCAIGWPLFRDGGMDLDAGAAALYLGSTGLGYLERAAASRCLDWALSAKAGALAVLAGSPRAVARAAQAAVKAAAAAAPPAASTRAPATPEAPAPQGAPDIEGRLRYWAAQITGVDASKLELDVNFGVYGFDSVSLAAFATRVSEEFAVDVAVTALFAHTTLGALARHVESLRRSAASERVARAAAPAAAPELPRPTAALEPRRSELVPGEVGASEVAPSEVGAIAVIGMSGRFPGAANLEEFWRNLVTNQVTVGEVPAERWDFRVYHSDSAAGQPPAEARWGGFIAGVDEFDARFFRISPREAEQMDPQHRLFLSACWHALEDAGYDPRSLAGRRVGVFAGIQFKDYEQLLADSNARVTAQACTGNAHALLPNRVSYLLDLRGPSESVDTACSSSLVALHRAVSALQRGEAEAALVGGVSLMLDPRTFMGAVQLGVLSPAGRCKTFDRAADGYARGEGVGVVMLKPLELALRAGDPIYGVIRATAVNHGGRAASMTAPSSAAQAALLVEAYERAQFEPESIGYIEAHGTGTVLGDPIEVEGINGAFAQLAERRGRALRAQSFCALGTAKVNIGHLEPAAGIAGLIKTLLSLQHAVLPGNPALSEPNPRLRLAGQPVYLLRDTIPWQPPRDAAGNALPRRAGVSSFGYGGSNAHAALEEWRDEPRALVRSSPPVVFVLSARDGEGLLEYARRHLAWLEQHRERLSSAAEFHDYVFTCQVGRSALPERLAVVVESASELELELAAFVQGAASRVLRGQARNGDVAGRESDAEQREPSGVAASWVSGAAVDWARLWPRDLQLAPRRARAPVYPFARTRYWFEAREAPAQAQAPAQAHTPAQAQVSISSSDATSASASSLAASSALEAKLLDRALLELASALSKIPADELSLQESLREYGFESITMIEFCRVASAKLGIELRPEIFFELPSPTLGALSDLIRARFAGQLRLASPEAAAAAPATADQSGAPFAPEGAGAGPSSKEREREAIAIVGMAGTLPGAADLDGFWQSLLAGKDLISAAPTCRWSQGAATGEHEASTAAASWRGGFIAGVDEFDAKFFGISPKEAELMDPQQRVFLTTVWKAVEDAGYRASELRARRTGLFVGVSANDYQELARDYGVPADAHTATGIAHSVLANRVSFLLDINGPSEPVDTACSASLIAIHRAVEQLQSGACDTVIAGGVNLILNPRLYEAFDKAGMLSPDGRCRTFDRNANGYVRGEGVGALVLKRRSDAERDGDHIYALIRGSATNHGGRANSLTAPNINAQAELLETAYERAGVDPATVTYIEAHGTGTPLGDPVEVTALKRAFASLHRRRGRSQQPVGYCGLGSVKSNIGHLETAAGVAGVFKVVLALRAGVLPGQLHFEKLNPLIDLTGSPFFIVDESRPWARLSDEQGHPLPRRAGVSGFGFGGANAHVVLEEYVAPRALAGAAPATQLVPVSARTEEALVAMLRSLLAWIERASTAGADSDPTELEHWLRGRAAEELGVAWAELDPGEDLRDCGLDSAGLERLQDAFAERSSRSFSWERCSGKYSVAGALEQLGARQSAQGPELCDLAWTLQVGREAFEQRAILRCSSLAELAEKLRQCVQLAAARGNACDGVWLGRAASKSRDREADALRDGAARAAAQAGRLDELAQCWLDGATVPWELLHGSARPRRLSLPTYCFARERHWLTPSPSALALAGTTAGEAAASPAPEPSIPGSEAAELILAAPEWRRRDELLPEQPPRAGDVVLCFSLDASLERELRAYVEAAGASCVALRAGAEDFAQLGDGSFAINTAVEAHYQRVIEQMSERGVAPTHVVHATDCKAAGGAGAVLQTLLFLCRALSGRRNRRAIRICHVHSPASGAPSAVSRALSGFAQALRVENPRLDMTVFGLDAGGKDAARRLWAALSGAGPASQCHQIAGSTWQHLALSPLRGEQQFEFRSGGVYVITGGASGLGLMFARYLARTRRAKLVLLGRSKLSASRRAALKQLEKLGAEVMYCEADVADRGSLAAALGSARARFGAIHGVLHSAGVTRDAFLLRKTVEQIEDVLASKVSGTEYLDELLAGEKLDFFVAFSSITALLGNVGQTDYAYANAYLNWFAEERDEKRRRGERHGRSLAMAWQFWGDDGGMVTNEQARRWMWKQSGILALNEQVGVTALRRALASEARVVASFYGDEARIQQRLAEYSSWRTEASQVQAEQLETVSRQDVEAYLARVIAEESKTELARIDAQEPLESYGLDSMLITALNRRLEDALGDLPKTLFFEHQTIAELAGYLFEEHAERFVPLLAAAKRSGPEGERRALAAAPRAAQAPLAAATTAVASASVDAELGSVREPLAIIGLAGRYPQAASVRELWSNLLRGQDCIVEIPPERWDQHAFFDSDRRAKGKTNSRWGGFIADVDKFDAKYFGIAPVEAKFMDPQERLFLEVATETLQDAGYNRESVRGRALGVFVGVTYSHYQVHAVEETTRGNPTSLGASYASIANRVSYYFDLRGPSAALDTMCSSSLTALHYACRAIWAGDCEAALVGGTNLSLHPYKYVHLSEAHFLSTDGRCRAFGEGGDGYVPGEGIGAFLIKPLSQALKARDHIYGVIRGIAVNHGGKTNGYSVPNPRAQSEVVARAWREAAIDPREIGYVEAHGTGTALGDPIEIAALTSAFREHTSERQFCPIGSIKGNVGHLEAAAAVIGITKVLLQLQHDTLVPSIHAEPPNPNLKLEATPFFVQRTAAPWQASKPRIAAVSSFGAGGSNAHVVLQEAPVRPSSTSPAGPSLFICSARSEQQLRSYAGILQSALEAAPELALEDVCFTLQVGRDELPHRLAIVASERSQLLQELAAYRAGRSAGGATWTGVVESSRGKRRAPDADGELAEHFAAGELALVARSWVEGAQVPWRELARATLPQRVSLPAYPFARERHWFASTAGAAAGSTRDARREAAPPSSAPPSVAARSTVSEPSPAREQRVFEVADPVVCDHQVRGALVVPGVALLDLALGHAAPSRRLERFAWLKPVVVGGAAVGVRVERAPGQRQVFHAVSGESQAAVVHARWELGRAAAVQVPGPLDLKALRARLQRRVSPQALYERYAQNEIVYGPSFQRITELFCGDGELLARIDGPPRRVSGALHVQTIDAALQGLAILAGAAGAERATYVPFSVGSVRWERPCSSDCWALVRQRSGDGYDVRVANAAGDVCLMLEDLCIRRLRAATKGTPAPAPELHRFFYRSTWLSAQER